MWCHRLFWFTLSCSKAILTDSWEKGFMKVKLFHNFYEWNLSLFKDSSLILSPAWYKNLDRKSLHSEFWICTFIVIPYHFEFWTSFCFSFRFGGMQVFPLFSFLWNVMTFCLRATFFYENSLSSILWNFLILVLFLLHCLFFVENLSPWFFNLVSLPYFVFFFFPVCHTFIILQEYRSISSASVVFSYPRKYI